MNSSAQKTSEPQRQPLRIPGGWLVDYNELREVDPAALLTGDDGWRYLDEDLLQIVEAREDYRLDVGWYPELDETGAFTLVMIRGGDWDNPVFTFSTRSLPALVEQIEDRLTQHLAERVS